MGWIRRLLTGYLRSKILRAKVKETTALRQSRATSCRPAEECLKERLRSGSNSTTVDSPSRWMNENSLGLYDPYAALKNEQDSPETVK